MAVVDDFSINVPAVVVTQVRAVDKQIILRPASIEFVISRHDQEVHIRVRTGKALSDRPANDQGVESLVVPVFVRKPIDGSAMVGLEFHRVTIQSTQRREHQFCTCTAPIC